MVTLAAKKQVYNAEYKAAYYKKRCEQMKAYQKRRYAQDPIAWRLKSRKRSLRLNFWPHLTNDEAYNEYIKLLELQDNKCAICKKPETKIDPQLGTPSSLAVDHCHKTKKVRALLCFRCNTTLGSFERQREEFLTYLDLHETKVD